VTYNMGAWIELFSFQFMQRALLAGTIVGILCPTVGVFLVLKRLSMVGDTIAHVSLAGVLGGLLLRLDPILAALITAVVTAFGIEKVRRVFCDYAELALAIFTSVGLGLAVILFNVVKSSDTSVQSLLFGSIVSVTGRDIWVIWILGLTVLTVVLKFYREFFYLTFDEDGASLAGINTKLFNYLLLLMTASIVAVGMPIIGALLISSLFVLPVAASLVVSYDFKSTLIIANMVSVFSVYTGIILSYFYDVAPGGAIIVVLVGIMILIYLVKSFVFNHPKKARAGEG
jgi:zinc transport system permease protein